MKSSEVNKLDDIVHRFGMSLERFLYYGRSRLGNEVDDTLTAYYSAPRDVFNDGSTTNQNAIQLLNNPRAA